MAKNNTPNTPNNTPNTPKKVIAFIAGFAVSLTGVLGVEVMKDKLGPTTIDVGVGCDDGANNPTIVKTVTGDKNGRGFVVVKCPGGQPRIGGESSTLELTIDGGASGVYSDTLGGNERVIAPDGGQLVDAKVGPSPNE